MDGEIRHGEAASGGYRPHMTLFFRAQRQITVVLEQHTVLYVLLKLRRIDITSVHDVRLGVLDSVHVDPAVGDSVHNCYVDCRSGTASTVFSTARPLALHSVRKVMVPDA